VKYKVVLTRSAVHDIKNLDSVAKKKIQKKILQYSQNPLGYAVKLHTFAIGTYRWRAGNYRIIFDIKGKTIAILRIRHRREVYK